MKTGLFLLAPALMARLPTSGSRSEPPQTFTPCTRLIGGYTPPTVRVE